MISHLMTESCKFSAIKSTLDWVSQNQENILKHCVKPSTSCPCHMYQKEDSKCQTAPVAERLRCMAGMMGEQLLLQMNFLTSSGWTVGGKKFSLFHM